MLKVFGMGVGLVLLGAVAAVAQVAPKYRDAVPVPDMQPSTIRGELSPDSRSAFDLDKLDKPSEPSEYWLGIGCAPVPPPLRAQLDLPEKQGLLVQGVAPDSPAAKAGILQHDILLRAGDKPLAEPRDLIGAIEATKEEKLKIDLIHGGQRKTVEATPAKRPEEARRHAAPAPGPGDWETMQKWIERMTPGEEGEGRQPPMRFRFFHPGAIVPRDVLVPVPLPPNMSVVISKEGDEPAKIVVKRGDEKWEATEKELDKLPADVRPHVERMLGRGPLGIVGDLRSFDFLPETPATGSEKQPPRGPGLLDRLERRFDEMNRRMDQLFKAIEELGKDHGQQTPVEK